MDLKQKSIYEGVHKAVNKLKMSSEDRIAMFIGMLCLEIEDHDTITISIAANALTTFYREIEEHDKNKQTVH